MRRKQKKNLKMSARIIFIGCFNFALWSKDLIGHQNLAWIQQPPGQNKLAYKLCAVYLIFSFFAFKEISRTFSFFFYLKLFLAAVSSRDFHLGDIMNINFFYSFFFKFLSHFVNTALFSLDRLILMKRKSVQECSSF